MTAQAEVARVTSLIAGARRIADPGDPLGIVARRELPGSTGLSPEGVELGLRRCLETHPSDAEVRDLVRSVPRAPKAHVLLSANVFIAAHRAIALALAASDDVVVRPSRREPVMARLLARAAPDLFRVVERLEPRPGDHVWAYGEDATLATLRTEMPEGVVLHAHGLGFGVVFVDPSASTVAEAVADDVVVFDQRGCLSPRVVFVLSEGSDARAFAEDLSRALDRSGARVPLGRLEASEVAERTRYRDTMLVAGTVLASGNGLVGLDLEGRAVVVPPVGRNVHVMRCSDPESVARTLGRSVTTVGVGGPPALVERVSPLSARPDLETRSHADAAFRRTGG